MPNFIVTREREDRILEEVIVLNAKDQAAAQWEHGQWLMAKGADWFQANTKPNDRIRVSPVKPLRGHALVLELRS